jgi:threonine/homoserine/homoserine lactone efflux protein
VLDGQLLAFMGVALVISVTPGPDMALVLRNSIRGGRAAAYRTILGTGVGLIGWATASAVGIAAVLAASATVFTVLKLAGAVYLVYLGLQTLLALRRGEAHDLAGSQHVPGSPFRQGLVTNLLTRSSPSSSRRCSRSSSRPTIPPSRSRCCSQPCSSRSA